MRGLALAHLGPADRQPGVVKPAAGVHHLLLQHSQPVVLLLFGLARLGHRGVRFVRDAAGVGDRLPAVLLCSSLRVAPSPFSLLRLALRAVVCRR